MTVYNDNQPEEIINLLGERLPPGSHILDLGCGEGRNLLPLARLGHNVEGWDRDEKEIRTLRKRAEEEGLKVASHAIDIRNLMIEYDRWDAILTILCMHFLTPEDAKERLRFVRSKIKTGGYHALRICTNNGTLARLRSDRYYPKPEEIVDLYSDWKIIHHEKGKMTCANPGPAGQKLDNEYVTILAQKLVGASRKSFPKPS